MRNQLSNARGMVSIENGFAVAYAIDGETELDRIRLPVTRKIGEEFVLRYVPRSSGNVDITALMFIEQDMMKVKETRNDAVN